jgi:hypothetical protein
MEWKYKIPDANSARKVVLPAEKFLLLIVGSSLSFIYIFLLCA